MLPSFHLLVLFLYGMNSIQSLIALKVCKDEIKGCEILKVKGMCSRDIMSTKCTKTCRYCGPNCADTQKSCPRMKQMRLCTKRKPLMKDMCPSTCGLCEAPAPVVQISNHVTSNFNKGKQCTNKWANERCKYYAHIGWCDKTEKIRINCNDACVCSNKSHPKTAVARKPCKGSKYGCCWDKKTRKQDRSGKNCPACSDDPRFIVLCTRFGSDCEGRGNLAISLNRYCSKTCRKC